MQPPHLHPEVQGQGRAEGARRGHNGLTAVKPQATSGCGTWGDGRPLEGPEVAHHSLVHN